MSGQDRSGQVKTFQEAGRTGQDKTGRVRTGQDRSVQVSIGQDGPGQVRMG